MKTNKHRFALLGTHDVTRYGQVMLAYKCRYCGALWFVENTWFWYGKFDDRMSHMILCRGERNTRVE